jgi:hypothetical protein
LGALSFSSLGLFGLYGAVDGRSGRPGLLAGAGAVFSTVSAVLWLATCGYAAVSMLASGSALFAPFEWLWNTGTFVIPVAMLLWFGGSVESVGGAARGMTRSVSRTTGGAWGAHPGTSGAKVATKERELLEAIRRHGEITAAQAALETSLSVEEAERVLSGLAAKGHVQVRVLGNPGGIFYSFWERDAPE